MNNSTSRFMSNLQIVLVEPQGDGNIGSVARAMKNYEVISLSLINPVEFNTPRSREMACRAIDILESARVVSDLKSALGNSTCSVGFTARVGRHRKLFSNYDETMEVISQRLQKGPVATVFGREDDGLTNEELDLCEYIVTIPASKNYSSLNLSQAVIIACHDIFRALKKSQNNKEANVSSSISKDSFISKSEYEHLFVEFKKILSTIGYSTDDSQELGINILNRLDHIFARSGLCEADIRMFEGLIKRLLGHLRS